MSTAGEAVDVVVVGAGGAGLAAAVSAAEVGARVLVLEQRDEPGGKTAMAMGSLTASGTAAQRRLGVEDSDARHREDLRAMARAHGREGIPGDPSPEILVEDGGAVVDWLETQGVVFSGPHPEGPYRAYRLHCAVPDGRAYVDALRASLERLGGRIRPGARVTGIDRDERATLRVSIAGDAATVRAGSVVLAAGDYSAGLERFGRRSSAALEPLADWARGDAQALAQRLGACLAGMDRPPAGTFRFVDPPFTEPDRTLLELGAIVVDETGAQPYAGPTYPSFFEQTAAGRWYIVFGAEVARRLADASADRPGCRDGWLRTGRHPIGTAPGRGYDYLDDVLARPGCETADSPAALAAATGIDPAGLSTALSAQPPFVALGPLRSRIMLAHGGARVDASLRVLDAAGRRVAGLYAAGNAAAWLGYVGGHGYSLAWALTSGRRAGRAAAAG